MEIEEKGPEGDREEPQPKLPRTKKKRPKMIHYKALSLGPVVIPEAVPRVPFDIYTVSDTNVRLAWKPPRCHKVGHLFYAIKV